MNTPGDRLLAQVYLERQEHVSQYIITSSTEAPYPPQNNPVVVLIVIVVIITCNELLHSVLPRKLPRCRVASNEQHTGSPTSAEEALRCCDARPRPGKHVRCHHCWLWIAHPILTATSAQFTRDIRGVSNERRRRQRNAPCDITSKNC